MSQRQITHERPLPNGLCGHTPRHYEDSRNGGTHILICQDPTCCASSGYHPTIDGALYVWTGARTRALTPIQRVMR